MTTKIPTTIAQTAMTALATLVTDLAAQVGWLAAQGDTPASHLDKAWKQLQRANDFLTAGAATEFKHHAETGETTEKTTNGPMPHGTTANVTDQASTVLQ